MERRKFEQRNRQEREALIKVVQEKVRAYMKKNAFSEKDVYKQIRISHSTFTNIMRYCDDGSVMLPRLDVLYRVENFIDGEEFLKTDENEY